MVIVELYQKAINQVRMVSQVAMGQVAMDTEVLNCYPNTVILFHGCV